MPSGIARRRKSLSIEKFFFFAIKIPATRIISARTSNSKNSFACGGLPESKSSFVRKKLIIKKTKAK
jgi:hypothetical protein